MKLKRQSSTSASISRVIVCVAVMSALLDPGAFAKSKKDKQAAKESSNPYEFIKMTELPAGQVFVRDMVASPEARWSASAFSAASDLLALDNHLRLTGKLGEAQVAELTAALFKDLPVRGDNGDVRVVMVGGFFGEKSPLIVIIDNVALIEGKVPGHSFAYRYITNAMNFTVEDKKTGESSLMGTGYEINTALNYIRLAVPCDGGNLVLSNNLTITPVSIDAAKDDAELGNDMDTVVKDEFADNDGQALEIYKKLSAKKDLDPGLRLLVELNYYLYLLKANDLANAEKALAKVTAALGDSNDESFIQAVKVEAPFLMRAIKSYEVTAVPVSQ